MKKFIALITILSFFLILPQGALAVSKMDTVTDNFDDNTTAGDWGGFGNGGLVNINGQIEILQGAGDTQYDGLESDTGTIGFKDLTSSSVYVQIIYAGVQTDTNWEAYPLEIFSQVDVNDHIAWLISGGTLSPFYTVNSVNTFVGPSSAYNPATMKCFRIRESGGTTFWDYSSDTACTSWTNYTSVANPAGIDETSMHIEIIGGKFAADTTNQVMIADNLNVSTATCDPSSTFCTNVYAAPGYSGYTPTVNETAYVSCWAGGGGAGDGTNTGGGGAGGGAYASSTVSLIANTTYTIFIGDGGSGATVAAAAGSSGATTTFATTTVVASPGDGGKGASAANSATATGGRTSQSTGTTKNAGGDGGTSNNTGDTGGGGGGAGGPDGAGSVGGNSGTTVGADGGAGDNGSGGTAGTGGNAAVGATGGSHSKGGAGGGGADDTFAGGSGGLPGGGGGGGEGNATTGKGSGAPGQCVMYHQAVASSFVQGVPRLFISSSVIVNSRISI